VLTHLPALPAVSITLLPPAARILLLLLLLLYFLGSGISLPLSLSTLVSPLIASALKTAASKQTRK
jgi:hypothetical protein